MIPDFPKEKAKLMNALNDRLARKHRELLGYFAQIPSFAHHEGDRWAMAGRGSVEEEMEYEELGAEVQLSVDEVPDMSATDILRLIDSVAEDAARQMHNKIMADIDRSVTESGTAFDAKGRPFDREMFLNALDSIALSFDSDGNLIPPAIIMHPELWQARKADMETWESDPDFVEKYRQLLFKKREEWRAREARRKLVD